MLGASTAGVDSGVAESDIVDVLTCLVSFCRFVIIYLGFHGLFIGYLYRLLRASASFHTVFVVQQLIASSCRLDLRFLVNSTLLHTIPYTQDEFWTPLVSRSAILEYKFKSAPRFLLFSSKHAFERCAREMKRPTESCNKRTYSTCIRRWPRSIATGQEEEPLMAHTLFITSSRKSPKI